jgi:hypothetical protein
MRKGSVSESILVSLLLEIVSKACSYWQLDFDGVLSIAGSRSARFRGQGYGFRNS